MDKKRPLGVTIIGLVEMIPGLIGIILSLILIFVAIPKLGQQDPVGGSAMQLAYGEMILIVSLLISAAGLITFLLKPLGRILHLIFLSLIIISSIYMFVVYAFEKMIEPGPLCIAAVAAGLLFYFTRPEVKQAFSKS